MEPSASHLTSNLFSLRLFSAGETGRRILFYFLISFALVITVAQYSK